MLLYLFATIVIAPMGEIRTCMGCKLNQLPALRIFIKQEAKKYGGLYVNFIDGHDPELVVYSDRGAQLEIVDLSIPLSIDELNEILLNRGFKTNEHYDL